mmetsp:Transcript_17777/g.45106  ORF Transcript_17777/g.45106 Transcript_17777/m.45106 type:complete len:205 (+) Transcript_17777:191-805(+)
MLHANFLVNTSNRGRRLPNPRQQPVPHAHLPWYPGPRPPQHCLIQGAFPRRPQLWHGAHLRSRSCPDSSPDRHHQDRPSRSQHLLFHRIRQCSEPRSRWQAALRSSQSPAQPVHFLLLQIWSPHPETRGAPVAQASHFPSPSRSIGRHHAALLAGSPRSGHFQSEASEKEAPPGRWRKTPAPLLHLDQLGLAARVPLRPWTGLQ